MSLRIEIRRSPRLVALILFSHLGALAIVAFLDISQIWRGVLGACVLVSLALQWKKHVLPGADAIAAIQFSDDGQWSVRRSTAELDEPARLVSHFTHPRLIVLRLRTEQGKSEPVILAPDTHDAETLRQMRVRLAALHRERGKVKGER